MASKRNPVIGVLTYFETAPLEAAQTALATVRRTVAVRTAAAEDRPVAVKRRRRRPNVVAGGVQAGTAAALAPSKARRGPGRPKNQVGEEQATAQAE